MYFVPSFRFDPLFGEWVYHAMCPHYERWSCDYRMCIFNVPNSKIVTKVIWTCLRSFVFQFLSFCLFVCTAHSCYVFFFTFSIGNFPINDSIWIYRNWILGTWSLQCNCMWTGYTRTGEGKEDTEKTEEKIAMQTDQRYNIYAFGNRKMSRTNVYLLVLVFIVFVPCCNSIIISTTETYCVQVINEFMCARGCVD